MSYAELGLLMTIFFVVSCIVQTLSGFVVDRFGPRPVLFAGLALLGLAAFGFAASQLRDAGVVLAVLAGVGNGVFHPVDYTLLNRKVHRVPARPRLQRARHHRQPRLGAGAGAAGPADDRVLVAGRAGYGRGAGVGGAGGAVAQPPPAASRSVAGGQARPARRGRLQSVATSISCAFRRSGCASRSSSSTRWP